uniref:Uncharacterized protein n=1 Tax=Oryza rufipogon TaxID=4529 RepID=A0A0E0QIW7_ORYRU
MRRGGEIGQFSLCKFVCRERWRDCAFVLSVELLCVLSASAKFVVVDLRLDLKRSRYIQRIEAAVLEEKERQLGGMHHVVYTYKI